MPDTSKLQTIQSILNQAERELAGLGAGLQFVITPEGIVEIVRRASSGLPAEPKRLIAQLRGCDPMMWQADRPEGAVTLGMPYVDAEPRCTLSRGRLERGAAVDLYYRGRPLAPERAADLAPRLAMIRGLIAALGGLLAELETLAPHAGEASPVAAGDAFRRWEVVWQEMAARAAADKGN